MGGNYSIGYVIGVHGQEIQKRYNTSSSWERATSYSWGEREVNIV